MVDKKGRPNGRKRVRKDSGFDYLSVGKNRSSKISEPQRAELADRCSKRIARGETREAFRRFLKGLLDANAIPPELLMDLPGPVTRVGKTKFEQLYDACMFLAFPEYREMVRDKAFGPGSPKEMRLWRALFPKSLGITHAVIRANSFQQAFALACDYACRLILRAESRIPIDMTIRVQFIGDKQASRILAIRHAVRDATRKPSNAVGRRYSDKDIAGARLVAVGRKGEGDYSIFKYAEAKDLKRIRKELGQSRVSSVDFETFRPKETP